MKVIIAGSRGIEKLKPVRNAVQNSPFKIDEVVHGNCGSGVDQSAEMLAKGSDKKIKRFNADWDDHGKIAGPIRNQEMAEYADALIAVWDGESSGTQDMISKAMEYNLDIYIKNMGKTHEENPNQVKLDSIK